MEHKVGGWDGGLSWKDPIEIWGDGDSIGNQFPRGLVLGHRSDPSVNRIGTYLRKQGFFVEFVDRLQIGSNFDLTGTNLIVSLGSDWRLSEVPKDQQVVEAIKSESKVIADLIHRGVPIFGICFGAQMIAHVLGGKVRRSPTPEFGWTNVTSPDHPQINGEWMQWHSDLIELPPGVEALGFNEVCIQAFRHKRSFGVQFHPEATYDLVLNWISTGGNAELEANGVDAEGILRSARVHESNAEVRLMALFDWFLQNVAST